MLPLTCVGKMMENSGEKQLQRKELKRFAPEVQDRPKS